MDDALNRPIKELIDEYPALGPILDSFGIGCVPCAVGTCLLKDIVQIHSLSPEDEQTLMRRIADVVHPGREIVLPPRATVAESATGSAGVSPPIRKLVAEHTHIKRFAALVPRLAAAADVTTEEGRAMVLAGVEFIRSYADRYHHAKEEDILFTYFDPAMDILQVMHADHETARAHVRAILDGVERRDRAAVREHLLAYGELLPEHIRKEDDILYPWLERQLTDRQIGEMYARFRETDEAFGDVPERMERFVATLEERLAGARADAAVRETGTHNERYAS